MCDRPSCRPASWLVAQRGAGGRNQPGQAVLPRHGTVAGRGAARRWATLGDALVIELAGPLCPARVLPAAIHFERDPRLLSDAAVLCGEHVVDKVPNGRRVC